jgi:hypothetical protein
MTKYFIILFSLCCVTWQFRVFVFFFTFTSDSLQIGDIICFNFSGLCDVIAPRRIYHTYTIYMHTLLQLFQKPIFRIFHIMYDDNNVVPNSLSFPSAMNNKNVGKPKEFAFDVCSHTNTHTYTTAEYARRDWRKLKPNDLF